MFIWPTLQLMPGNPSLKLQHFMKLSSFGFASQVRKAPKARSELRRFVRNWQPNAPSKQLSLQSEESCHGLEVQKTVGSAGTGTEGGIASPFHVSHLGI